MTPFLLVGILLAAAVTVAFWAGYIRRRAMFMAEASNAEYSAVFDLGMRVVDGKIIVRLSYDRPIRLGGFSLSPSGSISLEGRDLDVLEDMIRRARSLPLTRPAARSQKPRS